MSGDLPSIFLGYSFKRGNPRPWEFFEVDRLMVNAYDIVSRDTSVKDVHKLLSFEGEVFCDSGGWQIVQGGNDLGPEKTVSIQGALNAELSAVLDHGLDEKKHLEYLEYYVKYAQFPFVPVIPYGASGESIRKTSELVRSPKVVGIGKLVPVLRPPIKYGELRKAIRFVLQIKKTFPRSRIHVFGLGGLYTILVFFLLVDSVDSSSWVHDARFGKVRLLGGNGTYSTHPRKGLKHLTPKDYDCDCPICQEHSLNDLDARGIEGLKLRAVHNAWVLSEEQKKIIEMKENSDYLEYLRERVERSPQHLKLLTFLRRQMRR